MKRLEALEREFEMLRDQVLGLNPIKNDWQAAAGIFPDLVLMACAPPQSGWILVELDCRALFANQLLAKPERLTQHSLGRVCKMILAATANPNMMRGA